jgi:hypothetical protein
MVTVSWLLRRDLRIGAGITFSSSKTLTRSMLRTHILFGSPNDSLILVLDLNFSLTVLNSGIYSLGR